VIILYIAIIVFINIIQKDKRETIFLRYLDKQVDLQRKMMFLMEKIKYKWV
jgi:hypothetical protein